MGRQALATAQEVGNAALIASAASALCLAETVAGEIEVARGHRQEAQAVLDLLPDAELAPRLEALYYLAWAETYLEHYDDADRPRRAGNRDRQGLRRGPAAGAAASRQELSRSRCSGRLSEAIELCDIALEAARLRRARTSSTAHSSSSAGRSTTRATSTARSPPTRRACVRPEAGGRDHSQRWRRAGVGTRRRVVRERRGRACRTSCCSSSSARTGRARCPSSAASTGRA